MAANIDWYRGDPNILRSKWLVSQRKLGAVGDIAGAVARGYQRAVAAQQAAQDKKAALIEAYERAGIRTSVEGDEGSRPAEALAESQSEGNLQPTIAVGPTGSQPALTTAATNEPELVAPGRGTTGTSPGEGTGTQPQQEAVGMPRGPYAADLDPISRAIRWAGSKAGFMAPAAPGPSTGERLAQLTGRRLRGEAEQKLFEAAVPLYREARRPLPAAAAAHPGIPGLKAAAEAGGGAAPASSDIQTLKMYLDLARRGDLGAAQQVKAYFDQLSMGEGYPIDMEIATQPDTSNSNKLINALAQRRWEERGRTQPFEEIVQEVMLEIEDARSATRQAARPGVARMTVYLDPQTEKTYLTQEQAMEAGLNPLDLQKVQMSLPMSKEILEAMLGGKKPVEGEWEDVIREVGPGGVELTE